jgi:hypothetical protein
MLGEYKKALPLWQQLPVSYSCESEGILHIVPRDESMTRNDGMVQYGLAPGEEPRAYTADICAEVGHERCKGIKPTIEGYKGKIILCICGCHQFVALEPN